MQDAVLLDKLAIVFQQLALPVSKIMFFSLAS